MIKLIAADMDGTLLNSQKELSPNLFPLLEELKNRGILFAVASGRQYYNLTKEFAGVNGLSYISENGGMVFHQGNCIFTDEIPWEDLKRPVELIQKIPNAKPILCGVKSAYLSKLDASDPEVLRNAKMYYERLKLVPDILEAAKQDHICKIAIFDVTKAEQNTYPALQELNRRFRVLLSGEQWVDVMNSEVNKGKALKALMAAIQATPEETMAFGDYLNDYEMMQSCYYSYAMANAHPDLKAVSNFQAKSNDEDGVVKAIQQMLQKN